MTIVGEWPALSDPHHNSYRTGVARPVKRTNNPHRLRRAVHAVTRSSTLVSGFGPQRIVADLIGLTVSSRKRCIAPQCGLAPSLICLGTSFVHLQGSPAESRSI